MDTKLIKKLIRCYFFKNYYTNISFYPIEMPVQQVNNKHRHYPYLHALEYPLFASPPNLFLPPLKYPTWLPTCLRHFSPTFTSALPPLLPPHYRQNNICTDILHRHLHRHLHRQNSINLQRSQTNCKLITFVKLSQKG